MRRFGVASMGGSSGAFVPGTFGLTTFARGTGNDGNASSTLGPISPGISMSAGNIGVLCISMDNASGAGGNTTGTPTGYTDSAGNIWYRRLQSVGGTALANAEGVMFDAYLQFAFTTSHTLSITLGASTTAKSWTWTEVAAGQTGGTAIFCAGTGAAVATTAAPTVSHTTQFPTLGQMALGFGAAESTDTWAGDPDTGTAGTWSAKQSDGINMGTAATSVAVISQTKICTDYVQQSYSPTLTSCDVRVLLGIYYECDPKVMAAFGNAASAASTNFTFRQAIAAGVACVFCFASDNSRVGGTASNMPTTCTDSKSNSWTLQQTAIQTTPSTANSGVEIAMYTCILTTPLVPGDTITITYTTTNVGVKTGVIYAFAPTGAGAMTYVASGVSAGNTSSTISMTTGSIASGDYVVCMTGVENTMSTTLFTPDTDTTNGNWSPQTIVTQGTAGLAGISLTTQYKKVTATGTQTYDTFTPGASGTADAIAAWVQLHDSS